MNGRGGWDGDMPNSPGSARGGIPPVEDAAYEALLAGSLRPADTGEGLRPLAEAVAALTVAPSAREAAGEADARAAYRAGFVRPSRPAPGRPPAQAHARLGARRQAGGGGGRDRRWPDRRGLRERAARPGAELRAPHRGRARAARGRACGAASHPGRAGAVRPGGQPRWPHAVRGAFAQPGWPLLREAGQSPDPPPSHPSHPSHPAHPGHPSHPSPPQATSASSHPRSPAAARGTAGTDGPHGAERFRGRHPPAADSRGAGTRPRIGPGACRRPVP